MLNSTWVACGHGELYPAKQSSAKEEERNNPQSMVHQCSARTRTRAHGAVFASLNISDNQAGRCNSRDGSSGAYRGAKSARAEVCELYALFHRPGRL